jgi:hypothetical protein
MKIFMKRKPGGADSGGHEERPENFVFVREALKPQPSRLCAPVWAVFCVSGYSFRGPFFDPRRHVKPREEQVVFGYHDVFRVR